MLLSSTPIGLVGERKAVSLLVLHQVGTARIHEQADRDLDQAAADLKLTFSKIDKAGARRVLHPNTAARRKSKLARDYAAALAKANAAPKA